MYLKSAKLNPSDGIPFLSLGKMFAIPVLKKKVKNGREKLMKKVCSFNRPFPKCKAFHMKSSFVCILNFELSLTFIMRFKTTRKWPI